jgi:molybdate transport system substrate-binding protein
MSARTRLSLSLRTAALGLLLAFQPAASAQADAPTLTVSAASSLSFALEEAARAFERNTGIRLALNFGSTGALAQQIEQGAPVDLFVAADTETVEELERQGLLVPGSKQVYARGRLALYCLGLRLERLEDLARPEVRRIAMANPELAPYGAAAREALKALGLWDELQPRLILAENVRQALLYAETGNVEAALVAASLYRPGAPGQWLLVPEELHRPLDQALALVRGTRLEREARLFAAYLRGPGGRAILRAYGYQLPPPVPAEPAP